MKNGFFYFLLFSRRSRVQSNSRVVSTFGTEVYNNGGDDDDDYDDDDDDDDADNDENK